MVLQIEIVNFKKREAIFVISSMVITLAITLLSAYYNWGYKSAFALATGMYSILTIFAFITSDTYLKKLLFLGLVAGIVELLADKWLVHDIHSLVYPANEPKIWYSPNYMPFAWAVVLVQVGYLGRIIRKNDTVSSEMLICFILGIAFIPVFEQCAYYAHWWYYNPCKMLLDTPWYIIISEGLICSLLPLMFSYLNERSWLFTLLMGIIEGLWIFVSYFLMYYLFE